MWNARVIQVIETSLEQRGRGVEDDPIRRVRQFWTLDGELLAEVDPCQPATESPLGRSVASPEKDQR